MPDAMPKCVTRPKVQSHRLGKGGASGSRASGGGATQAGGGSLSRSSPRAASNLRDNVAGVMKGAMKVRPKQLITKASVGDRPDKSETALGARGLQRQINDIRSQVVELRQPQTQILLRQPQPCAHASATDMVLSQADAHSLNAAMLRAVQSSQQMRQPLEMCNAAALNNEALIERAQHALSTVLRV